jgi:hypothetical protein
MCMCLPVLAANKDDPFVLIPEAENKAQVQKDVDNLGKITDGNGNIKEKSLRDEYDDAATKSEKDVGAQLASGIMNRNTIFWLLTQVVKFVANAALIVWSCTVIYAGYLYAMSIYAWDESGAAKKAITTAIKGIIIVIFSYAILRIVIFAFL